MATQRQFQVIESHFLRHGIMNGSKPVSSRPVNGGGFLAASQKPLRKEQRKESSMDKNPVMMYRNLLNRKIH